MAGGQGGVPEVADVCMPIRFITCSEGWLGIAVKEYRVSQNRFSRAKSMQAVAASMAYPLRQYLSDSRHAISQPGENGTSKSKRRKPTNPIKSPVAFNSTVNRPKPCVLNSLIMRSNSRSDSSNDNDGLAGVHLGKGHPVSLFPFSQYLPVGRNKYMFSHIRFLYTFFRDNAAAWRVIMTCGEWGMGARHCRLRPGLLPGILSRYRNPARGYSAR